MITPIQKNKVYEDISTQIKQQIEDGTWKEGERIQGEIELAKEFQVGRSSIREAIKSLQVLGILRHGPDRELILHRMRYRGSMIIV